MLLTGLLNARLDRPDDADAQLAHVPLLGMLPVLPDDLAKPEQAALAAHCVHEIRTRLQILAQGSLRHTFAVTSPTAGAGKTSLTLALGLSFAAANQRTLMIDCDIVGGGLTRRVDAIVRRRIGAILVREGLIDTRQLQEALANCARSGRRIGEVLVDLGYLTAEALKAAISAQGAEAMGLLDALEGEDVLACVAETGIDRLFIMPLGSASVHDAASLSVKAFQQLLDSAAREFDVVIVDTGPILGSLEASVVASQADAVVLAVAKGEAKSLVTKAMAQVSVLGTRIAGMVFNRARDEDVVRYGSHISSSHRVRSGSDTAVIEHREVPEADRLGPMARAVASWSPAMGAGSRRARGHCVDREAIASRD
jgi:polysaccharide biosynthesis transport protein